MRKIRKPISRLSDFFAYLGEQGQEGQVAAEVGQNCRIPFLHPTISAQVDAKLSNVTQHPTISAYADTK